MGMEVMKIVYISFHMDKLMPENLMMRAVITLLVSFGNSCKCFMYNTLTNLCTPCAGISAYSTPPIKQEGDLFFSDTCDSYPDFRIYSDYLLSTFYAAYIDIYLNYTDAVSVCQCLRSNMYSAKTMDKYLLYSSITNFQNYDWLGLDDIKTEGKFVWAEDGTEIGTSLKLLLFAPGQPDNGWGSNEDCVQIIPLGQINAGKLGDANCGNLARFTSFSSVLVQCEHLVRAENKSFHLSKTVRLTCGPQRLNSGWTTKSRLDCVVMCRRKFGNSCKCFMYNKLTNLCTPCTGISAMSNPPSDPEGDLYFSGSCDGYPDFSFYSGLSLTPSYSAFIDKWLNYTDATSVCKCLESNMFSPKNWNKYQLFLNITGLGNYEWVGLDDIESEGKFVWAEDGTEIDPTLKWQIFSANQPDNVGGPNEDCVHKWPIGNPEPGKFNDGNCVLVQCRHLTDAVSASLLFSKTVRSKCGPQRLASGWTSKSKLHCAIVCREKYGNSCKCFMYNKWTKLCTPCAGINATSSPPSIQEGDLFFIESCDGYPDFSWYSLPLLPLFPKVYAAYFRQFLNYRDATSVCECLESKMFSPKTFDKYTLFLDFVTDLQDFDWVGLDDIKTEGKFVWALDGTEIDPLLKISLFSLGQPDNGVYTSTSEDCVQKWPWGYLSVGTFNDAPCGNGARFACEKPQC
ncbi:hypothetical protein Btru_050005 [Bulinus truncatus]|nr:hypothetical protein Btru_050005 [Bulinus truncatus]